MMKSKYILSILLVMGIGIQYLQGQMAGNPIGSKGRGEWTVSAIGTYVEQQVGSEMAISRRIFVKSNWGLTPWLDLYAIGGGVQVNLKSNSASVSDYSSKYHLGYGIGFNMVLKSPSLSGVWISAGGQALRFSSKGSFTEQFRVETTSYMRDFDMTYDWREARFNVGLIIPTRSVRFYLAGAGWLVQRYDTKREFLTNGDVRSFIGEEDGELRSGLWTGGIAGIEFLLPNRFSITIEGLVFNDRNYQVTIGLCQTGRSTW